MATGATGGVQESCGNEDPTCTAPNVHHDSALSHDATASSMFPAMHKHMTTLAALLKTVP